MKPAYMEELEALRCSNPECMDPECSAVLAIVPSCHPYGVLSATYHKSDGALRVACAVCGKPVIAFQIAHLPPERLQ